ncbi:hypothetical protein H2248_004272 [Termitomyces sp. 'cryptogamus']|nr:hypothetical protein H2248_004272 [Termitomyces sp. 'cryptogamus']
MPVRSPYRGTFRKLVLAFDVGTTYSGISYRFPAQAHVGGDSKIPTIIIYDQYGVVRAVGAEALKEGFESMIEEESWIKVEWFKLHLRPSSNVSTSIAQKIPPLPKGKTVLDVLSDFLGYLYKCARSYVEETHANGVHLWTSFQDHIEFILTHPNGWEGAQQSQMRKAATRAGLIPDTEEGRSHVHFVTEGEASLHFCIQSGLTVEALKGGEGVLIVDAGGGTVDITAYSHESNAAGLSFQEIATPQCFFQGSVFVTNRARAFLEDLLQDSKFVDDVDHITRCFDKTTKLRFRDIKEPQFIKFGTSRDKDLSLGIRSGQLKLKGTDIATFFLPSIRCILDCILNQRESSSKPINHIFLVGGFAASDWLFCQLKDSLEPMGITFSRPDNHVNKAVADGGVSFYIDHFVSARIAKYTYGIQICHRYKPSDPEHESRFLTVFTNAAGYEMVPGAYSIILPKACEHISRLL